ncbi:MAG: 4Fe-4S dicluster domain-containing protein [Lewinellaceae bacterium]|nr:4Fe-4S dicluster domain-containing protein [Lewinellaceae bacterium]
MKNNKNIWIGEKDLTQQEEFLNELDQEKSLMNLESTADSLPSMKGNRRDFLKVMGFGIGAATIAAGCDIPVKRAIPYVVKPDTIVPGVANYYASTYVNGGDYCSVLVKTREGRPIKIEGNISSNVTKGGTSARTQASVLSLYDTNRYREPQKSNEGVFGSMTWSELDKMVMDALSSSASIKLLSNTIMSPMTFKAIEDFKAKYPNVELVSYDPVSFHGALTANEKSFGERVMPDYRFDKADYIVSFGADFLGTWLSPIEFAKDYASKRVMKNSKNAKMSRHVQVESHMSMTGSNADNRILVKPSEQGAAIAQLYNSVVGGSAPTSGLNEKAKEALTKVAQQLKQNAGKSIVVSASNNVDEQLMVNAINQALSNYGNTMMMASASLQRTGDDAKLMSLIKEMNAGSVSTLVVLDCNPAYDCAYSSDFVKGLSKVKTKVAVSYSANETSVLCDLVAPKHHYLESWGDAMPKKGSYSLIQPTIAPLFSTRQTEETLLRWAGVDMSSDEQPMYSYLTNNWKNSLFASQSKYLSFDNFINNTLHDGVFMSAPGSELSYSEAGINFSNVTKPANSELEVSFFETIAQGNGEYSNNPWLMEMSDPVARTSWGNYLAIPVHFDGYNKMVGLNDLDDGDLVNITINGKELTVAVVKQFGQMPGTVALALGYGRTEAGDCGTGIGVDVNPFTNQNGNTSYYSADVQLGSSLGKEKHYSCVQYHHTYGVKALDNDGNMVNADEQALGMAYGQAGYQGALTDRSVVYTTNLKDLGEEVEKVQEKRKDAQFLNSKQIYRGFDAKYENGHHWGMHVDLNACIGCGACTVACMAENNVPVVGKKEVSRHHEMAWLRIDRYFYGELENPNTVYHPMMCQHCDNAPCENVCPVNATSHSTEGLNQMTYNRCVGTRYCANNCPYKVRRFNWLDYTTADIFPVNQPTLNGEKTPFGADDLTRMVLNPDVTVRVRGVIEKCSFCVQRLQEGKLTAKKEGRKLRDADVKSACQTACPTGAITFGDFNNKGDVLDTKLQSDLNYIALEEINVRSSVTYTIKVNNRDESITA